MSCDIIRDAGADGVTLAPWIFADIFAAHFWGTLRRLIVPRMTQSVGDSKSFRFAVEHIFFDNKGHDMSPSTSHVHTAMSSHGAARERCVVCKVYL